MGWFSSEGSDPGTHASKMLCKLYGWNSKNVSRSDIEVPVGSGMSVMLIEIRLLGILLQHVLFVHRKYISIPYILTLIRLFVGGEVEVSYFGHTSFSFEQCTVLYNFFKDVLIKVTVQG